MRIIRIELHNTIRAEVSKAKLLETLTGLALGGYQAPPTVKVHSSNVPSFEVHAFREARRLRDDGRVSNQVFITMLQTEIWEYAGERHAIRCGSTLVIDLDEMQVSYVIRKGLGDHERLMRIIKFKEDADAAASLAATYFGASDEPFAALHSPGA